MRILLAAVAAMVLTVCAHAQPNAGNITQGSGPQKPSGTPAPRVNDKDFNAALKRVPEPNAKFDAWGGVREEPKSKKEAPKSKK